ncbi:hypothetical protein JCM5296_007380 [Sporobolomyces johnsonii]
MPIGLNETYYARIVNFWPHGASLTVSYAPGRLDLTIPLPMAFVIGSNQNNLAFVQYIAQILVNEPGSLRKAGALNVELDMDEAPVAGEYLFVPAVATHIVPESRPDAFAKITGHEYQYLPSAGILLDLLLDSFYKAYKWSLYKMRESASLRLALQAI